MRSEGALLGGLDLIDTPTSPRGRRVLRFGSFSVGAIQRGLSALMAECAALHSRADVPVAILNAPSLQLVALWLELPTGDVLLPVPPAPPPPLVERKPTPADQALAAAVLERVE